MPGPTPFQYPLELWDLEVEGETLVMLHVTELGVVDSVYVDESSGFAGFDSAAVRGAMRLRFAPGRQGERRVDVWTRLPVVFQRDTTPKYGLGAVPPGSPVPDSVGAPADTGAVTTPRPVPADTSGLAREHVRE
jgi:TonB family protein